jgi:hypothetical protein
MNLREKIARQFGIELAIGDGDATEQAPIRLLDRAPEHAVTTAVTFLDCLHQALGQIFRIAVVRWAEPPLPPGLLEVGVLLLNRAEPAADPVSRMFLFDPHDVLIQPHAPWPPAAFRDPAGIELPLQIGCLHYRGHDDRGADDATVGRAYAYGGEGNIKLTAYVYAGQSPGTESVSQRLRREFALSERGVEAMFKSQGWQGQKFTTHTDPERHVPLSSGWITSTREETAVFLGLRKGMLVKVRFTHEIDYPKIAAQWLVGDVNAVCALSDT